MEHGHHHAPLARREPLFIRSRDGALVPFDLNFLCLDTADDMLNRGRRPAASSAKSPATRLDGSTVYRGWRAGSTAASAPAMFSLGSTNAKRRGLLAAVRDRMRYGARGRATEDAESEVVPVAPRAVDAPSRSVARDDELEQIAAEARYHRDRLALYRARMHGTVSGTSLTRLRELERIATAARERLRHARRARSSSHPGE